MKKILSIFTIFTFVFLLSACNNAEKAEDPYCADLEAVEGVEDAKIGMVTDAGTINDKSFNELTWNGITCYESKHEGTVKYVKPDKFDTTGYVSAIENLIDAEYEIIVTPGFKFEQAIYQMQDKYPEISFVLIDGTPNDGDYSTGAPNSKVGDNTVSINFAEEQAGFLAGVAAALQTTTNKLGFVGGMEIPAVQRFGWGYVAGVAYANENLGTNAQVTNYNYTGDFENKNNSGNNAAISMYGAGIDIIFTAAGGTGLGVIKEAKDIAKAGDEAWVIGVDSDQYYDGVYGDDNESVILTSAMKRVDVAAYNYIAEYAKGDFPGGTSVNMTLAENAVGLPKENPNLTDDTLSTVDQVKSDIIDGDISVPTTVDELNTYLTNQNYTTASGIEY